MRANVDEMRKEELMKYVEKNLGSAGESYGMKLGSKNTDTMKNNRSKVGREIVIRDLPTPKNLNGLRAFIDAWDS